MIEFVKKFLTPDTPNFRKMPNMPELEVPKNKFHKQMEERERVESRLRKAHFELQKQVEELTLELSKCREFLRHEISERREMEENIKNLRETIVQLYKKNRYEAIVNKTTQSVHQSINVQEVLDNAVDSISEIIDGVDYISIYLVEGKDAVMKSQKGLPDWYIEKSGRITYPRGFMWKAIIDGDPIYRGDVENDGALDNADEKMDIKSYLFMPLQSEGKTIGVVNIKSLQANAFGEEQFNLINAVKKQVETALWNAQQAETLGKLENLPKDCRAPRRKDRGKKYTGTREQVHRYSFRQS